MFHNAIKVSSIDLPEIDNLRLVFQDGVQVNMESLDEIRARVLAEMPTLEVQDHFSIQIEL